MFCETIDFLGRIISGRPRHRLGPNENRKRKRKENERFSSKECVNHRIVIKDQIIVALGLKEVKRKDSLLGFEPTTSALVLRCPNLAIQVLLVF